MLCYVLVRKLKSSINFNNYIKQVKVTAEIGNGVVIATKT